MWLAVLAGYSVSGIAITPHMRLGLAHMCFKSGERTIVLTSKRHAKMKLLRVLTPWTRSRDGKFTHHIHERVYVGYYPNCHGRSGHEGPWRVICQFPSTGPYFVGDL